MFYTIHTHYNFKHLLLSRDFVTYVPKFKLYQHTYGLNVERPL